jgi:hypothetical protein
MNALNIPEPIRNDYSPAVKIATMERAVEKLKWQREKFSLSYKSRMSSYRIEMGTRLLIAEMWIAKDEFSKAENQVTQVQSLASLVEDSEVSIKKCFDLLDRIQVIRNRTLSEDDSLSLE